MDYDRSTIVGSSREYWLYAKECAKWATQSNNKEDQDLFIDMAKLGPMLR